MSAQELQELGMDESRLAQKTAQMEALVSETNPAREALAYAQSPTGKAIALEHPDGAVRRSGLNEQLKASIALVDAKPPRKRRSDAGKPKPKPAAIAQQPGFLSEIQAARLTDLINTQETRRAEYESAQDHVEFCAGRRDAARQELYDYLLELQGKGK